MSGADTSSLRDWIGRQRTMTDVLSPVPAAALSATLDYAQPQAVAGDPLPECWHWLYFHEPAAASVLGADGHPARGDFLPPVALPRRMWAGSRLDFLQPLRVGDEIRRVSTIKDVSNKHGRSGELVFVTVVHELYRAEELVLREAQDIVYREAAVSGAASGSTSTHDAMRWRRSITPDPVLLFRYSALTFNSHRIHYDADYARSVEGYPNLVVQGPLTATLLLDSLRREAGDSRLVSFTFRGVRPLFAGEEITLTGTLEAEAVQLSALNSQGEIAMQASAEIRR